MSAAMVFDAHFHIIDHAFPVVENNGFLPGKSAMPDYTERTRGLGIVGTNAEKLYGVTTEREPR
ncbi:hypothetical protein [Gordonia aichiensis]|uniref:Hydrolase n=1 Tax=Gordonia aichiensis NBRC 108223 TaxID=1220583 RepID=L7KKK2_9ACTN|nr:hypothetical protein [Gordonia aichiensis]GAC49415.1 hypothetical protein GOACH_13_00060 [Gordonia aichiensis NBRC 108223]